MNKQFLGKLSYALIANIISFVVSILTTLLVPKIMGNNLVSYGYFQLYFFYEAYLGFFHLGLIDGFYLKDGGKNYIDLDKDYYGNQFKLLTIFESIVGSIILLLSLFFNEGESLFIYCSFAFSIIVYLPSIFINFVLQETNKIKEYAILIITGRVVFLLTILLSLLLSLSNFRFFICGDLLGKTVCLIIGLCLCKEFVVVRFFNLRRGIRDAYDNIKIGINLLIANIADLLIPGIVRFSVQYVWSISVFGIVSLSISISNMLMVFISAIAVVLYPTFRNIEEPILSTMYPRLRDMLMVTIFGLLIIFYPISELLNNWIPQYSESVRYMAILFPVCAYASKMSMLIVTYMKVYRMEKTILKVNLYGVLVAAITTVISVFIMKDLFYAVIAILVNQMFRCIIAELALSNIIKQNVLFDICLEIVLTIAFVYFNWFVGGYNGMILYATLYAIYICKKRNVLHLSFLKS